MEKKTLIILGSSITALGVIRAARKNNLNPVIFDYISKDNIATKSLLAKVEIHELRTDEYFLSMLEERGEYGHNYLISTCDSWLHFIIKHRQRLEKAYRAILHPDNETLQTCIDKTKFVIWCKNNDLPIPSIYTKNEIEDNKTNLDQMNFPLLIRPNSHQKFTKISLPKAKEIANTKELKYWIDLYNSSKVDYVVSESLLSHKLIQYSVPVSRISKGKLTSFVARKVRPLPEDCAVGTLVMLSPEKNVENLARNAVELLNYVGICEVEILHAQETNKYYLIEINPRPWIQFSLAIQSRHDFIKFILSDDYDYRHEIKTGKVWVDIFEDLHCCFSKDRGIVRNGKLSLVDYFSSIFQVNVFSDFDVVDPLPCIVNICRFFINIVKANFLRLKRNLNKLKMR